MTPILIAGPCAAENESQVMATAAGLCAAALRHGLPLRYFRAGIWKPRSHPDAFAGAGEEALPWLATVQKECRLPVCVEVMNTRHVELCEEYGIRAVWIGARTGVNPDTVQQIADAVAHKPFTVMVKNPVVADLELWSGNVERFFRADVRQVMAIHRGFFKNDENIYRNAPCWPVPIGLKVRFPDLPVICDPSHLCGSTKWIAEIAQIALNYGFDGLMMESHTDPAAALSDARQQLTPEEWGSLVAQLHFKAERPDNAELLKQRSLLENIDNQLSELLQQRMKVIDDIAKIKKTADMPVVQPKQWQKVVKRYMNENQDSRYRDFIARFLELLHQASVERQK